MKILRYSFYRFYHFMKSVGNTDVAEYYAFILMSVLISLNAFSLISIVYIVSDVKISIGQGSKLLTVSFFFGLLILFYLFFIRESKHLEIIKKYEKETTKKKIIGNAIVISYILISVGLLALCFYFMIQRNKGLL
ncbi:MAG: hypothetical protein PHF63_13650 [Herbinix sp.]|nr:hypothetical protein [Herbinix sp.]